MKTGVLHEILIRVIPLLSNWLLRLWFATCRVHVHGTENREAVADKGSGVIASFWHYSLLYVFYHLRRDSAAVVVSASEDGEYIARLAHNLNFKTIRGSRNRGGVRALKEMLRYLKQGENLGVVADGSQGPALVVQSGSILAASQTGSPILPMAWSASRCFTFNSWDRTAVPQPFSRIDYYYGEVLEVPKGVDAEGIEHYRLLLESRLNDLYHRAWAKYDRDGH
jgi:lysophospholipid acyltransferase (LPLAT)-like uncharacterized protein